MPAHGNVIAQETVNGMAWLLKQIERGLFFGDSSLIPVQWDGLDKLITDGAPSATLNTIDMRGKPLTEDVLNDGGLIVKTEPNYGRATDLYLADGAFSDLAKQFYPAERFNVPPAGWQNGMVGLNIQGFYSQFGPVKFSPDLFIQFGPLVGTGSVGGANIPAVLTESVAPAAAPAAGSVFIATDAGDYRYKARAINRYGKSAPVTMTGPVTVASGDSVTMTFADGATAGTAIEVYRTDKDGAAGTERLMTTIARSGATTAFEDKNENLPGTSKAFLIQQNLEYFSFKQLAPAVKIPLATIDTSIRWMQLLGTDSEGSEGALAA
ncbi:MAG: hypothetical protein KJN79_00585 [Gammaproteobacteria bacterium]|nr:hypothetical protein [Gammaproteobacteria bacterium]